MSTLLPLSFSTLAAPFSRAQLPDVGDRDQLEVHLLLAGDEGGDVAAQHAVAAADDAGAHAVVGADNLGVAGCAG